MGRESSAEAWSAAVQIKKLPYDRHEPELHHWPNYWGNWYTQHSECFQCQRASDSEAAQKSAGCKSALEPLESGFQNGELRSIAKPAAKRELFLQSHTKLLQLIVVPSILARISARLSSALLRYRFAILFFFPSIFNFLRPFTHFSLS